jgi:hypothetical protein
MYYVYYVPLLTGFLRNASRTRTMSDTSQSPEGTPDPVITPKHTTTVTSHITYYTVVPPKAGSKAKPKDKKETKTKELTYTFSPTIQSYIGFLKAILAKHGEDKYNITEKRRYVFKVICPPAKAYVIIFY